MDWNLETLNVAQRHRLLAGLVIPRPIALVTTIENGVVNAAPFSFFNIIGTEPPTLVISIGHREPDQGLKDTARNINASGEFVVHLVDEAMTERMHGCSLPFPKEISEVVRVGFSTVKARCVSPPLIVEAPVAMECRLHSRVEVGNHDLFIGQIIWVHTRDGLVDPNTLQVQMQEYQIVGRLCGNRYVRTQDWFSINENAFLTTAKGP